MVTVPAPINRTPKELALEFRLRLWPFPSTVRLPDALLMVANSELSTILAVKVMLSSVPELFTAVTAATNSPSVDTVWVAPYKFAPRSMNTTNR
ncbi:MAG: hypothetical protein BWY82_01612 [Verrucomicrobia bacterium ADurb.Bin474]|nr:MAG: hypothetical protein BWY82_01612 [Verrucomicrobia bacterium ADurb.Bin474]